MLAEHVQIESIFGQLSSRSLTACATHASFQTWNSEAVLEPNAAYDSVRGLTLKSVGIELPVYTGKYQPARALSESRTGFVEGIERDLLGILQQRLNFSVGPALQNITLHCRFKLLENTTDDSSWLNDSSIGFVLMKPFSYSKISASGFRGNV